MYTHKKNLLFRDKNQVIALIHTPMRDEDGILSKVIIISVLVVHMFCVYVHLGGYYNIYDFSAIKWIIYFNFSLRSFFPYSRRAHLQLVLRAAHIKRRWIYERHDGVSFARILLKTVFIAVLLSAHIYTYAYLSAA